MTYGPIARIAVRYGVGTVVGSQAAEAILTDPDVMHLITAGVAAIVGAATEWLYRQAKRRGWSL